MLAIRMQRTGRTGHAQFRIIVQDSRRSPKSGNIVASLGNYDPHTKLITIDKEKAATFLSNGAQPSSRVAMLLKKEGVKLPKWVKLETAKERTIRNPEKRRSTRPEEEVKEETEQVASEAPAEAAESPAKNEDTPPEEASKESETQDNETQDESPEKPAGEPEATKESESKEKEEIEKA